MFYISKIYIYIYFLLCFRWGNLPLDEARTFGHSDIVVYVIKWVEENIKMNKNTNTSNSSSDNDNSPTQPPTDKSGVSAKPQSDPDQIVR